MVNFTYFGYNSNIKEGKYMNIIDAVIILMILMFGVIGFKRGVLEEVVTTVGTIIVLILSFYLKNPLANFLCAHLPFFNFGGVFLGLTSLNLVLYQLISFLIVSSILYALLRIVMSVTGVIEKILKFTIILGIPSKILGAIAGFIEGFVIVFVALFFLNQPSFNIEMVKESKLTPKILESTPVLSNIVGDFNQAFHDIYELSKQYEQSEDKNRFNLETVDILLKYHIVEVNDVEELVRSGKLSITGIDSLLNNYR